MALKGGLGEALQEGRASCHRTGWVRPRAAWVQPQDLEDVQRAVPAKQPALWPLSLPVSRLEGTWQVWGSSLEGAGFPGLLLWGWLSNTTGWSTDRQVP